MRPIPGKYKVTGNQGNFLVIFVDGVRASWAVFSRGTFDDLVPPVASGVIDVIKRTRTGEVATWWESALWLADELHSLMRAHYAGVVYGSCAPDLDITLGVLVGSLTNGRNLIYCGIGADDDTISPMSKVQKMLPKYKLAHHEWVAVGLGLYVKGKL